MDEFKPLSDVDHQLLVMQGRSAQASRRHHRTSFSKQRPVSTISTGLNLNISLAEPARPTTSSSLPVVSSSKRKPVSSQNPIDNSKGRSRNFSEPSASSIPLQVLLPKSSSLKVKQTPRLSPIASQAMEANKLQQRGRRSMTAHATTSMSTPSSPILYSSTIGTTQFTANTANVTTDGPDKPPRNCQGRQPYCRRASYAPGFSETQLDDIDKDCVIYSGVLLVKCGLKCAMKGVTPRLINLPPLHPH